MIYTSRYSNPMLKDGKYVCIGISLGTPKWKLPYEVADRLKQLMPWGLLSIQDKDQYEKRYIELLERQGVEKIQSRLSEHRQYGDIVLLCYEDVRKEGEWCHRQMFAKWWEQKTGEKVEELQKKKDEPVKKKSVLTQVSIFDIL